MKKLILLLQFIPFCIEAQSPRDNLLGHYVGMERQTDVISGTHSVDCSANYNIYPAANYPIILTADTVCAYESSVESYYIVMDDSTIWDSAYEVTCGRLFPNDSLYFAWYGTANPLRHEFFGFKQYSYPAPIGIKEQGSLTNQTLLIPQPSSDVVYLHNIEGIFSEKEPPILYDMCGKKREISVQFINAAKYRLDLSTLSQQIYIVEIKTKIGVIRKKIIVAR